MLNRTIWTNVHLIGWHYWPNAPEPRDYLRASHRHEFHIRPEVRVSHDDRDIEFHDLRDIITEWWVPEQGTNSCETIARNLWDHLTGLGLTVISVTVSEDGYEGATLA